MIDLRKYTNEFDPAIRRRGEFYLKSGFIKFISREDSGELKFEVNNDKPYQVLIGTETKKLVTSCTCPYYLEGYNCKHIWGSLLFAQKSNWFKNNAKIEQKSEVIPVESTPIAEVVNVEEKSWKEKIKDIFEEDKSVLNKKRITNDLLQKDQSVVYLIEADPRGNDSKLKLHFYVRESQKNSFSGSIKKISLNHDMIQGFQESLDQRALWIFLGSRSDQKLMSYEDKKDFVYVESALHFPLLKELSNAGKLFISDFLKNENNLKVEDEPLSMRLVVKKEDSEYKVNCEIHNSENQSLVHPLLIYKNPFVIFQNKLFRSQFSNAEKIIQYFKRDVELSIPENEIQDFMEYVFRSPTIPELILPTDLKYEHSREVGKVRLEITKDGSPNQLRGTLFFKYGNKFVAHGSKERLTYDHKSKTLFERNFDFEYEQIDKFSSATGLIFNGLMGFYQLSEKHLSIVTEKANELGWEAFAFSRKVQMGSDYKAEIKSFNDWFDLTANFTFENGVQIQLPELLRNIKNGDRFVQLTDGSVGYINQEWVTKFAQLMNGQETDHDSIKLTRLQTLFHGYQFLDDPNFTVDTKYLDFQKILKDLSQLKEVEADVKFKGELRPYQKKGLSWLNIMTQNQIGAVLADDMGLGKTIQVLSMLSKEKGQKSLIVAPKTLIFNWLNEAKKFTPHLIFHNHTGGERNERIKDASESHVIITTYQTLRLDIDYFKEQKFKYFIFDEAHYIKNSDSQSYMACKLIQADQKIALTGTPVENSLSDLFSILSVTTPGLISENVSNKFLRESDPDVLRGLSLSLKPFILRRTKDQVLTDLPDKSEQILYCELSPKEKDKYDELKKYYWSNLSGKIQEKGFAKSKIEILEALLRLRQASCHPGLLDANEASASSSKFDLLLENMRTVIADGHKVLVFSQFTKLLNLLKMKLDEVQIKYEYLDGKTKDREERVQNFQDNSDIHAFLISLKAGGVGLNLTSADYVYILDPWWNPAAESQAIDRAHRIGQKNKVFAYKIIAKGTVEEKILELQTAKKNLAKTVISNETSVFKGLEMDDLKELFG